jgi:phage tail-like protein
MATYPLPKFHFRVDWGGSSIGFSEVTGLEIKNKAIAYREGSSPVFSNLQMPGMMEWSAITLKRGTVAGDSEFYTWISTISMNTVERRDITISLLNENHEPVFTWKALNAFPTKVQASDLKADGSEVAIETLEITHEGLSLLS